MGAGVVSLMNLQGAIDMMMSESEQLDERTSLGDDASEEQNGDDKEETELAVDIVQLGTGARITCLAAWCKKQEAINQTIMENKPTFKESIYKRKLESKADEYMTADAVKKARSLV